MSIRIDEASAVISLDWAGVKPGISANPDVGVFHLGKGFKRFFGTNMPQPASAWSATGTVRIALGPGDTMKGWQFGFLQIMRQKQMDSFYAGRTRKEGSMAITPMRVVAGDLHIDTNLDSTNPWAGRDVHDDQLRPPVITCRVSDHPFQMFPLEVTNTARHNAGNILFHARDSCEFWTILSLRKPDGSFIHLKHFKWTVDWEVRINRWQGNRAADIMKKVDFTPAPQIIAGPPSELLASGLRLDGTETSINTKLKDAFDAIQIRSARAQSAVTENEEWFTNVPMNFFAP